MKQVYKDRLLRLADYLADKVPNKHFNLEIVVHDDDDCKGNELIEKLEELKKGKEITCGSAACAVGWLPAAFPRVFKWHTEYIQLVNFSYWTDVDVENKRTGTYNEYAAKEFFGLDDEQSGYLFLAQNYNSTAKRYVVQRIRNFVKNDGKINWRSKNEIEQW